MEEVKIPEIPLERKFRSVTAGLFSRIKTIYDGIYERFGEEGLDLIREMSRNYGLEIAKRARNRVKGKDAKSVGSYFLWMWMMLVEKPEDIGLEVVEFSDDRVAIKVTRCIYPFDKVEICKAHTTMEETLVEELGENLTYEVEKSIPAGDPYCLHVIKRKG
ncbi:MAG: L-2-amino-thiazoline-4-carboxylic acid hydrolase [Candidatus Syntropharchaeia archaeon]